MLNACPCSRTIVMSDLVGLGYNTTCDKALETIEVLVNTTQSVVSLQDPTDSTAL